MSVTVQGLCPEVFHILAYDTGVGGLTDTATEKLAYVSTIKIKRIIQDAIKHMYRFNRNKLVTRDIQHSIKLTNLTNNDLKEKNAASNLLIVEDDLRRGEQNLSFNQTSKANIYLESCIINDKEHILQEQVSNNVMPICAQLHATNKNEKTKQEETVHLKRLANHELSVEQQRFYLEVVKDCIATNEKRRRLILKTLENDPNINDLLLDICKFIAAGVKVNIVKTQLVNLINLMRVVKSLICNTSLYIQKCLHILLPSVISCVVSRQICVRPMLDNHWALREFAAQLITQICNNYDNSFFNIQKRVLCLYSKALDNENLNTIYGSVFGLVEFGENVIAEYIIPNLKIISAHVEQHIMSSTKISEEALAVNKITSLIEKSCVPVLLRIRSIPDNSEIYNYDYGFLGLLLCSAVQEARKMEC